MKKVVVFFFLISSTFLFGEECPQFKNSNVVVDSQSLTCSVANDVFSYLKSWEVSVSFKRSISMILENYIESGESKGMDVPVVYSSKMVPISSTEFCVLSEQGFGGGIPGGSFVTFLIKEFF